MLKVPQITTWLKKRESISLFYYSIDSSPAGADVL